MNGNKRPRILIIGGGFAGLTCVRKLRRADVEITLIDRHNYHLFQPLLYQVATGELSPANITAPLRDVLRRQKNVLVLMDEVTGIDVSRKIVQGSHGERPYDMLVVAAGAAENYFGHDEWAEQAPGLKSIEQATEIRRRILSAFEAAEATADPIERQAWLTFVIVGGGPTGVELAGALSDVANHTLKHDFRVINPSDARIVLVEAHPRPLSMYPESLSERAAQDLRDLHVDILAPAQVTDIEPRSVTVGRGDESEKIATRTVIWAAGVGASPLGKVLAEQTGVEQDRAGRLVVEPDLTIAGHPDVYVIGDLAACHDADGNTLPGLAPVAMQQGEYVAAQIQKRTQGDATHPTPFRYQDRGSMAVIGRYRAIALIGKRELSGLLAWLVWLFIHLVSITLFRNRVLVLFQWGWTYLTHDRAARLITGSDRPHPIE